MQTEVISAVAVAISLATIVYAAVLERRRPPSYIRMARLVEEMAENAAKVATRVLALEELLADREGGIGILIKQIEERGDIPRYQPNGMGERNDRGEMILIQFYELLAYHFNTEELSGLAFELGINPDDISGDTRSSRARSLLTKAMREGSLQKLREIAKKNRPSISWPKLKE